MCRLSYDIDGLLTGSGDIEWKVLSDTTGDNGVSHHFFQTIDSGGTVG